MLFRSEKEQNTEAFEFFVRRKRYRDAIAEHRAEQFLAAEKDEEDEGFALRTEADLDEIMLEQLGKQVKITKK